MLDNQRLTCLQCGGMCVENCSVSVEFFHTHATIVWFFVGCYSMPWSFSLL